MKLQSIESFEERVRRRNERRAAEGELNHLPEQTQTIRRKRTGGFLKSLLAICLYFVIIALGGGFLLTQFSPELTSLVEADSDAVPPIENEEQPTQTEPGALSSALTELADARDGWARLIEGFQSTMKVLRNPEEELSNGRGELALRRQVDAGAEADNPGLKSTRLGADYGEGVVLWAGATELPRSTLPGSAPPPALTVEMFDRNEGCVLKKPTVDQRFVGVRLFASGGPVAAHAFSEDELIKQLERMINAARAAGVGSKGFKRLQHGLRVVDVFVTDNEAPLYLTLQSVSGVAWRLHLADGVKLAHIALIGERSGALLEPPQGVPFEAILSRDFMRRSARSPFPSDSARPKECFVFPSRKPDASWTALQEANKGKSTSRNLMTKAQEGFDNFDQWHRAALGLPADQGMIEAFKAETVLIGPQPAAGATFRTAPANRLIITRDEHIVIGDTAALERDMQALHEGMIATAAGGDISMLSPPKMTR